MNSIKPVIQQLSNARQGINEKKNISENVERMKQAFDQLGPGIKQQLEYIQTMNPSKSHEKEGSEKLMESKRYFLRFVDLINHEIGELIQLSKMMFQIPQKQRNVNPEQLWEKVLYLKEKHFEQMKDQLTPETNYFELVFQLLNCRDQLMIQMIKSVMHRKLLLWKDMNIKNEPFIHAQTKLLLTQIEQRVSKGLLMSDKLEYKEINYNESAGIWKYQTDNEESLSISIFFGLLNETFEDLFQSLRNYCNLQADPMALLQVTCNQKQVSSLRSQIEILVGENLKLQQQLNELKLTKRSNEFEEIRRLQQVIEDTELTLSRKEREINELMANSKGSLSLIQNLRDKLKEVEEENHRYTNIFFPKQRELEGQQLKILDEFQKIKKDIDTYSSLFKMESQIREKAMKSKDQSDDQVQKLVDMLGRQKQKNKELQDMIKQKESIISKILEARREAIANQDTLQQTIQNHKEHITSEENKVIDLQNQINILDKKYQDMYEINTHFNKRIYDLEKQKKQLLDILKQHDIEPDPTKLNCSIDQQ